MACLDFFECLYLSEHSFSLNFCKIYLLKVICCLTVAFLLPHCIGPIVVNAGNRRPIASSLSRQYNRKPARTQCIHCVCSLCVCAFYGLQCVCVASLCIGVLICISARARCWPLAAPMTIFHIGVHSGFSDIFNFLKSS